MASIRFHGIVAPEADPNGGGGGLTTFLGCKAYDSTFPFSIQPIGNGQKVRATSIKGLFWPPMRLKNKRCFHQFLLLNKLTRTIA